MVNFGLLALLAIAIPGETHTVAPTTYYRTFSRSHPVLERVKPGDSIVTRTLDSAGLDDQGVKKAESFNPLNGPFFVEGAEPGDALVVRIKSLRMNRNWGWSAYRLGLFSITADDVEHVYSNQYKPDVAVKGRSTLVPWDLDLAKKTVRLREPKSDKTPMEFPASPMLGCIGVAPPGDFAPTSGPSGAYGGNLDYNRIGEGATVILPVYQPGALLFIGDGHALQGDGESTGTGIETSMDVELVVEVRKGAAPSGPRVELADEIISIGSQPEFASALDNGLKMATSDMVRWLTGDYGLEPWAAHLTVGYQGRYDVVTVAGSMALRIPKSALPAPVKPEPPKATQAPGPRPGPIAEKTAKLARIDGFFPLYWDEGTGKVWMEIARFDREVLYQVTLTTGVGSNPIGLDRGQLGDTRVVAFRRVGPKVLMEEPNYKFRALSDNPDERKSVEQSFARSVLWGFKVEAEEDGRVLVDASAFFSRDAHGVADRLAGSRQGRYKVDDSRGGLDRAGLKAFPKNTEVEATLTFVTDEEPGKLVAQTAPSGRSVTVRERHSLIELPELGSGYAPRKLDPRVGVFGIEFADFATPTGSPIETRWISRHRLIKRDPAAASSPPVAPLLYYVDRGAPEPIRSALVEGASWWSKAFEAAGFQDAFKVEVLPEGADPMDLRYNVIHWVHRSTRGWSYGNSVVDPRTGEILKGSVALDSQRARQDALIGAGLVPSASGCGMMMPDPAYLAAGDPGADPSAMVLARIRQLSAHEVGHTLGFAHNFAASTYGRGSVMDYPAPLVKIRDGKLDLSDAYARGIGRYDEFATRFAYAQFPAGSDEGKELARVVESGVSDGLLFLSDVDARPAGAAHPLASLWDNGDDPVAGLRHELEVRKIGLANFGLANLPEGAPLSDLEAKFLPLYLHHRYQLQAAVKTLGGVHYTNAVKAAGGPNPPRVAEIVPAEKQREALKAVLEALDFRALAIPPRILALIPPTAFGHDGGTAELFTGRTGPTFDPVSAATVAGDLAISALLQPQRAARLIEFHARDYANPDFEEVLEALHARVWDATQDRRVILIPNALKQLHATRLMELAANESASPQVRAGANQALRAVLATIKARVALAVPDEVKPAGVYPEELAVRDEVNRFLNRPDATFRRTEPIPSPPGDPIGSTP